MKSFFSGFLSLYSPRLPEVLAYMLQSTEYDATAYIKWFWRAENYNKIMTRRTLHKTKAARLIVLCIRVAVVMQLLVGSYLLYRFFAKDTYYLLFPSIVTIVTYPVVVAHCLALPMFVVGPIFKKRREQKVQTATLALIQKMTSKRILVAGSYGKTTIKELLGTILGAGLKVAITPANKNTPTEHLKFVRSLDGDEDIIVFELGEGKPGDVETFRKTLRPDYVFITGLAPAHLDNYPSYDDAVTDILSVVKGLDKANIFYNAGSHDLKQKICSGNAYSHSGCLDLTVVGYSQSLEGLKIDIESKTAKYSLGSNMIGEHLVGPIVGVCALGLQLGLSTKQIQSGVAKTQPYEHRMQPRQLNGAWIIDDTYNGNIEGIAAGIKLLSSLKAKRKIYVTPGLVDQGDETEKVHHKIGNMLGIANFDRVVLMQNSVTDYIVAGIKKHKCTSEIVIEHQPLKYYQGLEHHLAAGDIVLMQNDWTDNYA
jgi:UDP-N-acetylmuramoyl-tripeptide--D-alanyl-D-alanine ligase